MLLKKDNKYCMGTIIPSAPNEGIPSAFPLINNRKQSTTDYFKSVVKFIWSVLEVTKCLLLVQMLRAYK